jgi:hypothetical protein
MKSLIALVFATILTSCGLAPSSQTPTKQGVQLQASMSPVAQVSSSPTGTYPQEAIAIFMQGCTAGQPQEMVKTCGCMIQQLQARYTYGQYQALTQNNVMAEPGVQEALSICSDLGSAIQLLPQVYAQINNTANSYIVGQDGAFLGEISSSRVAEKSICNQVGAYGSQVTSTSIRNQVGDYGSQISKLSAYNPNAQNPPILIQNGQPVAVITKNRNIQGGLDPDVLFYSTCQ